MRNTLLKLLTPLFAVVSALIVSALFIMATG